MTSTEEEYMKFLHFCEENLTGSNKQLVSLVNKRYNECGEKYRNSQELRHLLSSSRKKMSEDTKHLFVHLKDCLNQLKAYGSSRKGVKRKQPSDYDSDDNLWKKSKLTNGKDSDSEVSSSVVTSRSLTSSPVVVESDSDKESVRGDQKKGSKVLTDKLKISHAAASRTTMSLTSIINNLKEKKSTVEADPGTTASSSKEKDSKEEMNIHCSKKLKNDDDDDDCILIDSPPIECIDLESDCSPDFETNKLLLCESNLENKLTSKQLKNEKGASEGKPKDEVMLKVEDTEEVKVEDIKMDLDGKAVVNKSEIQMDKADSNEVDHVPSELKSTKLKENFVDAAVLRESEKKEVEIVSIPDDVVIEDEPVVKPVKDETSVLIPDESSTTCKSDSSISNNNQPVVTSNKQGSLVDVEPGDNDSCEILCSDGTGTSRGGSVELITIEDSVQSSMSPVMLDVPIEADSPVVVEETTELTAKEFFAKALSLSEVGAAGKTSQTASSSSLVASTSRAVDESHKTLTDTKRETSDDKEETQNSKKKEVSHKHIHRLEKLLEKLRDKIDKIQERELSLEDLDKEDSSYIYEDKLKRKFVTVWNKLCELKDRAPTTGRPTERRFTYQGTRYPEVNKKIEKLINRKKIFPDFHDIKRLVSKVNISHRLHLSNPSIDSLAREAFTDVGNMLQRRRREDFITTFGCKSTDRTHDGRDPALFDPELRQKLEHNNTQGKARLEQVIKKYSDLQYTNGEVAEEVPDGSDEEKSNAEKSEEEEEEEDSQDVITVTVEDLDSDAEDVLVVEPLEVSELGETRTPSPCADSMLVVSPCPGSSISTDITSESPLKIQPRPLSKQVVPNMIECRPLSKQVVPEIIETRPLSKQVVPEITECRPLSKQAVPEIIECPPLNKQTVPEIIESRPVSKEIVPEIIESQPQSKQVLPSTQVVPEIIESRPVSKEIVAEIIESQPQSKQVVPSTQVVPEIIESPSSTDNITVNSTQSKCRDDRVPAETVLDESPLITSDSPVSVFPESPDIQASPIIASESPAKTNLEASLPGLVDTCEPLEVSEPVQIDTNDAVCQEFTAVSARLEPQDEAKETVASPSCELGSPITIEPELVDKTPTCDSQVKDGISVPAVPSPQTIQPRYAARQSSPSPIEIDDSLVLSDDDCEIEDEIFVTRSSPGFKQSLDNSSVPLLGDIAMDPEVLRRSIFVPSQAAKSITVEKEGNSCVSRNGKSVTRCLNLKEHESPSVQYSLNMTSTVSSSTESQCSVSSSGNLTSPVQNFALHRKTMLSEHKQTSPQSRSSFSQKAVFPEHKQTSPQSRSSFSQKAVFPELKQTSPQSRSSLIQYKQLSPQNNGDFFQKQQPCPPSRTHFSPQRQLSHSKTLVHRQSSAQNKTNISLYNQHCKNSFQHQQSNVRHKSNVMQYKQVNPQNSSHTNSFSRQQISFQNRTHLSQSKQLSPKTNRNMFQYRQQSHQNRYMTHQSSQKRRDLFPQQTSPQKRSQLSLHKQTIPVRSRNQWSQGATRVSFSSSPQANSFSENGVATPPRAQGGNSRNLGSYKTSLAFNDKSVNGMNFCVNPPDTSNCVSQNRGDLNNHHKQNRLTPHKHSNKWPKLSPVKQSFSDNYSSFCSAENSSAVSRPGSRSLETDDQYRQECIMQTSDQTMSAVKQAVEMSSQCYIDIDEGGDGAEVDEKGEVVTERGEDVVVLSDSD